MAQLGDMIFFHSYKNPGLVLDIVGECWGPGGAREEGCLGLQWPDSALSPGPQAHQHTGQSAKRTGMIILGGGMVKHHASNANLMVSRDAGCAAPSEGGTCACCADVTMY